MRRVLQSVETYHADADACRTTGDLTAKGEVDLYRVPKARICATSARLGPDRRTMSAFDLLPGNMPGRVREACNSARGRSRSEDRERRTEMASVTLSRDDWIPLLGGSWEAPKA